MNAFLRGSLLFSILSINLVTATESTVKVAGSRELRLAVIDGSKATTSRDLTHSAFAASLGQAVSGQDGAGIGVKVKCVSADQAAFNLSNGIYDAVLVLTGTLPRALMTSEVTRLNATLGDGKAEKKVYLVFNNGDQALARILAASFPQAMSNTKFLDALDGVAIGISGANQGTKIASTP